MFMRTRNLSVVVLSFMCLAACGGSTETVSSPVVGALVAQISVEDVYLGGPMGCYRPYPKATYDRTTHALTWTGCGASPTVTRVLSAAESAQVESSLQSITPRASQTCGGYDGEDYYLSAVDSSGQTHKYSSGDVNCYGNEQVLGLSDTYALLAQLR